ncbi:MULTISPECIES: hypothetical protein [Enterococcus]|uniref:hypothetical protein n=1 Tax=Enterococcus TaxID=1350 RepID=UPI000667011F|nr:MULTISPECIES: hypothetical protein [Enterococcus]MBC9704066.1 hypothetical protein [Enterococcus sp.]EHM3039068.1 hypothetical protein [Enterococcus faecium]EME8189023.1 hypothetical protein [Enterococcus faecium]EMF0556851.1 hypothetical protein [Enterococcus faecium]MBD9761057.1 hypothetical protein [Enterococcus faecium]
MESIKIKVSLNRELDSDPKKVSLLFDSSSLLPEIILSDDTTNDLKNFFNSIFNYIINNKKIIEFQLDDGGTDIFKEVADDIITQLNAEIKLSENNFIEFLELID